MTPENGHNVLHILLTTLGAETPVTLSLLKYFINNGADINIADKNGITPISLTKSKNIDIEIDKCYNCNILYKRKSLFFGRIASYHIIHRYIKIISKCYNNISAKHFMRRVCF